MSDQKRENRYDQSSESNFQNNEEEEEFEDEQIIDESELQEFEQSVSVSFTKLKFGNKNAPKEKSD